MMSVTFLKRVMKSSSIRALQNTITNSVKRMELLSGSSVAYQNELNRINAASQLLLDRGAPIYRDEISAKSISTKGNILAAAPGMIDQPWFKPALLIFGFYLYRKFL